MSRTPLLSRLQQLYRDFVEHERTERSIDEVVAARLKQHSRRDFLKVAVTGRRQFTVTCGPVIQEVIQGFDDERAFRVARDAMLALPILENPMTIHAYEQAADLYRRVWRSGKTLRSGVDCLIAACALLHDADVLHCDRDFDAIATIAPLRARNIARRV